MNSTYRTQADRGGRSVGIARVWLCPIRRWRRRLRRNSNSRSTSIRNWSRSTRSRRQGIRGGPPTPWQHGCAPPAFRATDVQVFKPAPRKGNLVARLRGTGARKPILLLAHLDVVEALPADWSFDPFKLTEKDGYYYGRGTADDKYMAATFVANLIRYKQEGYRPDRDIIVALETDEEIGDANALGIRWLIKNHRDLIDAEFALNEGGSVGLKNGKPIRNGIQTSEKVLLTLPAGGTQQGRPLLGAVARQRDLPSRGRSRAAGEVQFSAQPQCHNAPLFRARRRT